MRLTENFELHEFVVSEEATRRGIDNTPPPEVIEKLRYTAACLQGIRTVLGKPIVILSGYRSPKLNRAVGGARTSQHQYGEAVDWICPGWGRPTDIVRFLRSINLRYDQLIDEFPPNGWVHTSFRRDRARMEALVVTKNGTSYLA